MSKTPDSSKTPAYQQIANILRTQIVAESNSQARRLPAEDDLARMHGVARGTIRSALSQLAKEGLISRSTGRAAIISPEGVRTWQRMRHTRYISVLAGRGVLPEVPEGYMGQVYQGVLSAAEAAGYRCGLRKVAHAFAEFSQAPAPEDPQQVLGTLLLDVITPTVVAMAGYPAVCVDHLPVHPKADAVVVDCYAEAHQVVEFLMAHGHRDLFYVGNVLHHAAVRQPEPDALLMEAGYRRATRLAGLDISSERVRFCRHNDAEIDELADWLLALQPRPTAGLVFSPDALRRLQRRLERSGVRCPQHVSLICKTYDTDPSRLASVRSDAVRLGRTAVELLLGRLAGRFAPGTRVMLASRVCRGTTVRMLPV